MMTNAQFYFTLSVPLVGIVVNVVRRQIVAAEFFKRS